MIRLPAAPIPRKRLVTATAAALMCAALAACSAPSGSSFGHPDSLRAGPFWERNDQRDR